MLFKTFPILSSHICQCEQELNQNYKAMMFFSLLSWPNELNCRCESTLKVVVWPISSPLSWAQYIQFVHLSNTLMLSWKCQVTSIKTQFEASILNYLHIISTVSTMGNDCGLSSHLLPALQGPSATLTDLSWMLIRKEANCCLRSGHRWKLQNPGEVQLI